MVAPTEMQDIFNQILARDKGLFLFIARENAFAGEAQDLYQEILSQICDSLDRFEGRSDPATWATQVALNTVNNYRRNRFRRNEALRAYSENVQMEYRGGRGAEQILQEFTASLPNGERSLFAMFLNNMSYKEIAEVAGITEIALRVKISRLKDQFKQRYL